MKTALWLNPVATGSTSLDANINPHDVEQIAHAEILKSRGYRNILHEPFVLKARHSSWEDRIFTADLERTHADIVVMSISPFLNDYLGFKYWEELKKGTSRQRTLDAVTRFLDRHEGEVYGFFNDPRPMFQKILTGKRKKDHPIYRHIDRMKLIVADPAFLCNEVRDRAHISKYWKYVRTGDLASFCEETDYFCVYPGLKSQLKPRINQVREWFGDTPGCYTAGEIKIDGIPSATDFQKVSLSTVLDLTQRSKTALITGEPHHTWLTPRVIQSLCQGTICSIHPDFPGRHHFPDDILQDQTFETAEQFDHRLLTAEIYQRQLNFVRDLRNGW